MVGVTVNNTLLSDTLLNIMDNESQPLCVDSTNRCYLLDEGGFVISENLQIDGYSSVSVVGCLRHI